MKDVVFVTGNPNKAAYFAELVGLPIDHHKVELDEIQSLDVAEVAERKARQAYDILKRPVLVEDQGMYLPALGGFPGPFVKFMVDDGDRVDILSRILDGFSNRSAESRTVFVYFDGSEVRKFEGVLYGEIAKEPRGDGGWGWDPVFIPRGYGGRTRAELTKEEDHETYLIAKPIEAVGEFLRAL